MIVEDVMTTDVRTVAPDAIGARAGEADRGRSSRDTNGAR
jgi:hypothetical protein